MKLACRLLAILLAVLCLAGCAAQNTSDLEYVKNKGTMIVGITNYPPMDYKDENGEWTGFDAELARLVADKLGVKAEFLVLADWGKKIYELDSKNIDVIWNGMTITDEILKNASCSDPYVLNAQVVVMAADKIADYPDAKSLKGLTIAVENGSAGEDALKAAEITDYVALQDMAAALMEVAAGTADACVIDITMAQNMTGEGTDYANLDIAFSLTSEEYGIAFRKGSDITAKVNEILDQFRQDGTLQALADKYNLTLAE